MTREEQSQRKMENEAKRVEETLMLVNLFLETNESDIELSKRTGISSSTIGRRLTDKERICKAFPKNGEEIYTNISQKRQANLQKGKVIGGQTSMLNNTYQKSDNGKFIGSSAKLRLDLFYRDEDKQLKFLIHMALTFRTKLETLSSLFQIEEKELLAKLLDAGRPQYLPLNYLFYHDFSDQEIAKEKLVTYYRDLLNAMRNKDREEQKRLIQQVTDAKASEFLKRKIPGDKIEDEDMKTMLKYQLKYALTGKIIADTFGINLSTYKKKILLFVEKYPEFKDQYEQLANYNSARYDVARRGGRYGQY